MFLLRIISNAQESHAIKFEGQSFHANFKQKEEVVANLQTKTKKFAIGKAEKHSQTSMEGTPSEKQSSQDSRLRHIKYFLNKQKSEIEESEIRK